MGKTPAAAKARTLTEADISSRRCVSRRSILGALGLSLGAAAAAVVGTRRGSAQAPTGCNDNDEGPDGDDAGYGVNCQPRGTPTGCTDTDEGPDGDQPGYGVRCRPEATQPRGCTDNDHGPNEDQPGLGTRCWI
jgi:hypothetical protein